MLKMTWHLARVVSSYSTAVPQKGFESVNFFLPLCGPAGSYGRGFEKPRRGVERATKHSRAALKSEELLSQYQFLLRRQLQYTVKPVGKSVYCSTLQSVARLALVLSAEEKLVL